MGVNMRLFETDMLAGIELRFPNGKDWTCTHSRCLFENLSGYMGQWKRQAMSAH
jgi:hypothetical protein